jgi:hypothetical protein
MTFTQRFIRYLIGMAIGLVVVAMLFPNRNWLSWTPQSRMMTDIREFKFQIAPQSQCSMSCAQVSTEHVQNARQHGSINFELSQPQAQPKRYMLQYGNVDYQLELQDSTFTLLSVQRLSTNCTCP